MNIRAAANVRRVGIGLICAGLVIYGSGALWFSTRIDHPVNIPLAMTVGHVRTPAFKVNRNALYIIEVEVQKNIPFETLNCLLGTAMSPTSSKLQECPDRPSVFKMSWFLSSDGHTVAHGSTDDHRSGAWANNSVSRILGSFWSESGRTYVLDADVLTDGSALQPGSPHLKVEVSPAVYETEIVQDAILFFSMILLVLFGVFLLLISFVASRRARKSLHVASAKEH